MQGFRSPFGPQDSGSTNSLGRGQPGAAASWSQPSPANQPSDPLRDLRAQASLILQRIRELEAALATQEWWLLGRHLAEARVLAEEASLLAVARSELDDFFAHLVGRSASAPRPEEEVTRDPVLAPQDPQWLYAQREQAVAILRYLAAMLPPLHQQAEAARAQANAMRLGPALLDPLGIVVDHLRDAWEALSA